MRLLALLAVLLALLGARPALAVDQADRLAAFRERTVNWTTATDAPLNQQLADKFIQATGMKIALTRQDTDDALRRAVEEEPGRKGGIDVITLSGPDTAMALARKGLLAPFRPDGFEEVIDGAKDRDGRWIAQRVQLVGLPVRTDLLPESERPKAWSDLTAAKYKGRLVMADPQASAMARAVIGTLAHWLGWDFVRALRLNEPLVVADHAQLFKAMQQGERALGLGGLDPRGFHDGRTPPTQAMILPVDGVLAIAAPVAVLKSAKNPNAARLFAQFMVSPVAQRMVAANAVYSPRADVAPPSGQPALGDIKLMPVDFERIDRDAADIKARFSEIFR
jgi:iron(III) transport system substrate-binding protein